MKNYNLLLLKQITKIMTTSYPRPEPVNPHPSGYGNTIYNCPRCDELVFKRTYPQHWGKKHTPHDWKAKMIIDIFRDQIAKGREV